MNAKIFIALLATIVLASCGGNRQDFGYNEKMASLFYSCKEKADESYRKLLDGGFDADKADALSYDMKLKEAQSLGTYVNTIKAEASGLAHSEMADIFHANVIGYMSAISDRYAPLLVRYVEQQDSMTRGAILKEIATEKNALSAMEDKCLDSQIEFLNKAGIKVNTESAPD